MPHPGGRPGELTQAVIAEVERLLPECMYLETVASLIGVTNRAMQKWLKRGAKEQRRLEKPDAEPIEKEAIYLEFVRVHKKAIADSERKAIKRISRASAKQWQAAAWILERRFAERWGADKGVIAMMMKELAEVKKNQHVADAEDSET